MDFDAAHIALPFRMRPGLARLDADARHLSALDSASPLFLEKSRLSDAGQGRFCMPGFDPTLALASIAAQADHDGITGLGAADARLETRVAEDLALLDGATGTIPWMSVCVPSGWAPEEKLGLGLEAIHAPVADSAALITALPHLVRLLTQGGHWERHVWTISPSGRYDQHPHRHPRTDWPATADPEAFARQCYLRSERQTFFPVHGGHGQPLQQALFTIRVALKPLVAAVAQPAQAQRLHDALQSMGDDILAYKQLGPARARLLAWLKQTAQAVA